jgi:hypothetical protein
MEFFNIQEEKKDVVIEFLKGKESLSISELTNAFID